MSGPDAGDRAAVLDRVLVLQELLEEIGRLRADGPLQELVAAQAEYRRLRREL